MTHRRVLKKDLPYDKAGSLVSILENDRPSATLIRCEGSTMRYNIPTIDFNEWVEIIPEPEEGMTFIEKTLKANPPTERELEQAKRKLHDIIPDIAFRKTTKEDAEYLIKALVVWDRNDPRKILAEVINRYEKY